MNVEHERARLLKERLEEAGLSSAAAQVPDVPWRTHSILLQVVFFVLAAIGLGATFGFFHLLHLPKPGLVAGCLAIALAELLIRKARWYFTGVEAALWLGGLYAMISELPSSGTPEAMIVLGAAPAVAGARVRNPLFGALSAIFFMLYFEEKWDLGVIAALVIATIAVVALLRIWQRPSTEWLWIAIAIVMPVASYFTADTAWRQATIALYAGFALLALALAIRKRHHALFLSGGVAMAIAAIEVAQLIAIPLEAKLALGGALLLLGSWLLARAFRDRTTGIVVTPAQLTALDDVIEIAGTINIPQPDYAPATTQPADGGKFGGAGATGSY